MECQSHRGLRGWVLIEATTGAQAHEQTDRQMVYGQAELDGVAACREVIQ
jgi:hypothetical protein